MSCHDDLDIQKAIEQLDRPELKNQLLHLLNDLRVSRAGRSLPESEPLLGEIMDNMVAMVGLMKPDGTLLMANRTALQAANLKAEDVLGKPFEETYWWAWTPEVQKRLRTAIERCAAGNGSRYDAVIRIGEHEFRTIDFMLAPMFGTDGSVVYLVPSGVDITQRIQAEELIRGAARFPAENPNPVMRATVEGRLLYANPASQPLLDTWGIEVGNALPLELVQFARNAFGQGLSHEMELTCGPSTYLFGVTPVAEGSYINLYGRDITVRKQAEKALQQNALFYRQTLESIPGMVFTTRPDGCCEYQSQQWVEYTGVPMSEQLGDGWNALLHPEDRPRAFAAWQAAVRDNSPYDLEYRVRRHDGVYEWFRVIGRQIRDARGEVIRWFGVAMNIEQLKTSEQALRKGEEKFRSIFHTSTSLISISSLNEVRYIDVNDAFLKATGYAPDEVVGQRVEAVGIWVDLSRRERLIERVASQGRVDNEEVLLRAKSGQIMTALTSATFMELNGEQCVIFSSTDITARKLAEERFWTLADNMSQLAWIADSSGSRFWYNRRWFAFTGTTHEAVKGWGWTKVHHPDHVDRVVEKIGRCFRTGEVWEDTFPLKGKAGEYRWFLARAIPVRNQSGDITWWLGTDTDITEQRQAEEGLRYMNETLAQQVTERTALAENRARQLQALAVELIEAEESERRRIADMLHDDLQQLLAGARLMLQSVSESLTTVPEIQVVQQLLQESINKSRSLSHELSPVVLHHSGLVAGLEWLAGKMKAQFDLNTVLQKRIDVELKDIPLKLFVFRTVQELLFNIVKHAGVNSAQIELSSANGSFSVTVGDNGKGFDPEALGLQDKVGFGLLTIKERANYIGAKLVIDSAPGKGSRFTLTVPLAMTLADEPPPARPADDLPDIPTPPLASTRVARVLFADDHKVMRQGLIELIAGQPGISVVGEAANGREAVALAGRLHPDVVVMDVSMPEMDGIEATRRIKEMLPEVRVVGLSMHEDERIARAMCEAGAESFVSKTTSPARLLKAIYGVPQEKTCPI